MYQRLPESSAQILFPDRYLDKESPAKAPAFAKPPDSFKVSARGLLGAAHLKAMFEAPGDDEDNALSRPYARAAAWAGGRYEVWEKNGGYEEYLIGVSLVEHADHRGLMCSSMHEWYEAAFTDSKRELAGDKTVEYEDDGQSAVITCERDVVRMGLGPSLEEARLAIGR
jgi:hypothetical protein